MNITIPGNITDLFPQTSSSFFFPSFGQNPPPPGGYPSFGEVQVFSLTCLKNFGIPLEKFVSLLEQWKEALSEWLFFPVTVDSKVWKKDGIPDLIGDISRWITPVFTEYTVYPAFEASDYSQQQCLDYLQENEIKPEASIFTEILRTALRKGYEDVLFFLKGNKIISLTTFLLEGQPLYYHAAAHGKTELLKLFDLWLKEEGKTLLEVLFWKENGDPVAYTDSCLSPIVENGDGNTVVFLRNLTFRHPDEKESAPLFARIEREACHLACDKDNAIFLQAYREAKELDLRSKPRQAVYYIESPIFSRILEPGVDKQMIFYALEGDKKNVFSYFLPEIIRLEKMGKLFLHNRETGDLLSSIIATGNPNLFRMYRDALLDENTSSEDIRVIIREKVLHNPPALSGLLKSTTREGQPFRDFINEYDIPLKDLSKMHLVSLLSLAADQNNWEDFRLIQERANLNFETICSDFQKAKKNESLLHEIIFQGSSSLIEYFYTTHGELIFNIQDLLGRSILGIAAHKGFIRIFKNIPPLLLKKEWGEKKKVEEWFPPVAKEDNHILQFLIDEGFPLRDYQNLFLFMVGICIDTNPDLLSFLKNQGIDLIDLFFTPYGLEVLDEFTPENRQIFFQKMTDLYLTDELLQKKEGIRSILTDPVLIDIFVKKWLREEKTWAEFFACSLDEEGNGILHLLASSPEGLAKIKGELIRGNLKKEDLFRNRNQKGQLPISIAIKHLPKEELCAFLSVCKGEDLSTLFDHVDARSDLAPTEKKQIKGYLNRL